MIILATDTATPYLTVALCDDDKVIAEFNEMADRRHAELLMGVVDDLLKQAGLELSDVELLAVSRGPGSFTGLRVGVSAWKGLAAGASLPLAAVSTLDALAWTCEVRDGQLCVLLDAKMQEVYGARYEWRDGKLAKISDDAVGPVQHFLVESNSDTVFLGDGALLYAEVIREMYPDASIMPEAACMPRAWAVAAEGLAIYNSGTACNAAEVVPVYLRQSQAERNRSKAKASPA